jgi:hypothetical protein
LGVHDKPIQRKSAMKKSQQWDEKSSENDRSSKRSSQIDTVGQIPKRVSHMDNSFNSVVDEWSKQMAMDTMDPKTKKLELLKSQS